MGIVSSLYQPSPNASLYGQPTPSIQLDLLTKLDLIKQIQSIKPKNINFPDDKEIKMKNLEITNKKIIPMSIELYTKLIELFGEYKPPARKTKFVKRQYYVKPGFTLEQAVESLNKLSSPNSSIPLIEDLVEILDPVIPMQMSDITLQEFNESFNNAQSKKDMMGISKKILREMPNYLKLRFINTYNMIIANPSLISEASIAKGTYVYKNAKQGPINDISSFRQILAIPNIINQLHRILNSRLSSYLLTNKYLNTNIQKGGIAGQKFSILEQVFKLKNVLKDANQNKKSCVIVFLDIANAFGNLNLENLFKILELYHVPQSFIDYLKSFYGSLHYYQTLGTNNTLTSDPIKWSNGLIQGCAMSPLLFEIALNYILTHIDTKYKGECGYTIGNHNILLTAYVDDITIVCRDITSAKIVLDEFENLCLMLGLPLCKNKSACMIVNNNPTSPTSTLNDINQVNTFKYLGEYLSSTGTSAEAYGQFAKSLILKMNSLDYRHCSNIEKTNLYEELIAPWIQRKMSIMYDISIIDKLKIISIIKPMLEKWGSNKPVDIFCDIGKIINASNDEVIQSIRTTILPLDTDIELSNYIFKNKNIQFSYGQIDKDTQIDDILGLDPNFEFNVKNKDIIIEKID